MAVQNSLVGIATRALTAVAVVVAMVAAVLAVTSATAAAQPTPETASAAPSAAPVAPVAAMPCLNNDDFACATAIAGPAGAGSGDNSGFGAETGEPVPNVGDCNDAPMNSAWWSYTAVAGGSVTVDTNNSSLDTVLAVYTGTAVDSLTLVDCNDDIGFFDLDSVVTFNAVAGTTYWFQVDGSGTNVGSYVINVSAPCGSSLWTVTNAASLNTAINCYNASTFNGVISIANPFTLTGATVAIDNPNSVSLQINGGGHTIDGNNTNRHFTVTSGDTVSIDNITLTGGNADSEAVLVGFGGAVLTLGDLTITNSTLSGNTAVSESTAVGAYFSAANLDIENSTIDGNTDSNGGPASAVQYQGATGTIGSSTISNNGRGVGLISGSDLTVTNTTVSGHPNIAIFLVEATTLTMAFSTVTGNGDGLRVQDTATADVSASIVAGNTITDVVQVGGSTVTSGAFNVVGTTSGTTSFGASDLVGAAASPLNLGPLQVNAPGTTATYELLTGSVALDHVTGTIAANDQSVDQNGSGRPAGLKDAGAFEAPPANDDFVNAFVLPNTNDTATDSGTNVGATGETGEPVPSSPGCTSSPSTLNTVWWSWTAPVSGVATIDTNGSGYDTLLSVHTGSAVDALTLVGCDDDGGVSNNWSLISFTATAGTTYHFQVDGFSAITGAVQVNLAVVCGTGPWTAIDTVSLNFAIACFNAQTAAGTYQIDVAPVGGTLTYTAAATTIDNATAGAELVIDGAGTNTLDADGVDRVLQVVNGTVTLNQITLTGGDVAGDGGGLEVLGANTVLTIVDSTVSGNTSGNNGGGVRVNGATLVIDRSTISGNTGQFGGGVNARGATGSLIIENSTVSGNVGTGHTGGVFSSAGSNVIAFTTITNNDAPSISGLGINDDATGTQVSASIIAGNTGGPDVGRFGTLPSAYVSGGYNVIGTTSSSITVFGAATNDLVGQTAAQVNVTALGPFGGFTETHSLLPGSVALDHVSGTITAGTDQLVDQLGNTRPQASAKDAGSVEEFCPASPWTVTSTGSLNFAIACYNASAVNGVINIANPFTLTGATVAIDNPTAGLSVQVNGGGHTIDGGGAHRHFTVTSGDTVTFDNITLTNGNATGDGGALRTAGTTTVSNSTITNSTATVDGGGIVNNGTLTVTDSTISGNTALLDGGGILSWSGGVLNVVNSTINGNTAVNGGGIFNLNGTLTVENSTISDNTATGQGGGGIASQSANPATIVFSTITNNHGNQGGVDTLTAATTVNVSASIIAGNDNGDVSGGGSFVSGDFNVIGTGSGTTAFTGANDITGASPLLDGLTNNGGNTETHALQTGSPAIDRVTGPPGFGTDQTLDQRGTARPLGTAKDAGSFEAAFDPCSVTPWTATDEASLNLYIDCYNDQFLGAHTIDLAPVGGTITYTAPITTIINASGIPLTINGAGNTLDAAGNGSVLFVRAGTVSINDITLTGGSSSFGGGLRLDGVLSDVTLTNSTVTANTSTSSSGGIDVFSGSLMVVDSTISGNTAGNAGGGIGNFGTSTVVNSTISGNTANSSTFGGGGIFTGANNTTTIVFSTVTGNRAAIGSGLATLTTAAAVNVSGSLVAGNLDLAGTAPGTDIAIADGSADAHVSGSFNVIGTVGANVAAFGAGTNDLTGQTAADINLAGLALNAGGSTLTHEPQPGSVANQHVTGPISIGVNQDFDQNGTPRPMALKTAGAVEGDLGVCDGKPVDIQWGPGASGTSGDDVILGTSGPDTITGLGGNDTICGLGGADTINGGPGDDTIFGDGDNDTIFGLDGEDEIHGGTGDDELIGFGDNDTIYGNAGQDTINGGPGDDNLYGGDNDDDIFGQAGNDTIEGGNGNDFIIGVTGNDTINGDAGNDTINGGPDNDTIEGGDDNDTIFGLTGDDDLSGDAGNDTIFGQPGIDTIDGGVGDDLMWGNEDNDTVTDPSGTNTINGGPGDDTLTGGTGTDNIFGDGDLLQAGDDVIDGGAGTDLLVGFNGNDTITSNDGEPDTVNGGPNLGDTCTTDPSPAVDTVFNCT